MPPPRRVVGARPGVAPQVSVLITRHWELKLLALGVSHGPLGSS